MLIVCIILEWLSLQHGYTGFVNLTTSWIHQEENRDVIFSFVTENEFCALQIILGVWIAGLVLCFWARKKIFLTLQGFISFLFAAMKQLWREIAGSTAKYILLIPFGCSVYYASTMPVTYDEAWTYLYFTINSPIASVTFYPASNNHILFSLISNFTSLIPFLSPLFAFRISSVVISSLSWSLLFIGFKKWTGEKPALLITAVSSMLFMSVYYSYMARGYALVILFFILASISVWNLFSNNNSRQYWILYVLTNVLGCYTMPSFLFVLAPLSVLLLTSSVISKTTWLKAHLAILVTCFLLYVPVMIVNGIDVFSQNISGRELPLYDFAQKIIPFFIDAVGEITGWPLWVWSPLGVSATVYLIWKKRWQPLRVFILFILLTGILLVLHPVIPYSRSLIHFGILIVVFISLPFISLFRAAAMRNIFILAICLQGLLVFTTYVQIRNYDRVYRDYHTLAMKIMGEQKRYYFNSRLFDTTFAFEMRTHGYRWQKAANAYPTKVHPMSADTVDGYDYIVIDRRMDITQVKKPIYTTPQIHVYQ